MAKFKRFEGGQSQKPGERRREDLDKFDSVTRRKNKLEKRQSEFGITRRINNTTDYLYNDTINEDPKENI
tara:strand:+ start:2003 stop:2212 length:210 start_codon:yes stop_codon:yes gene_type:complete